MTTITISHSHAEGTVIGGSRKGDGVYEVLAALRKAGQGNWRFSRDAGLYLGQSRDRNAQAWKIDKAAQALREAGLEVTVEVDEGEARPFAEQEDDRYARAEDRADRFAGYAENAAARSTAAYEGVRRIGDGIPFGQPILVGHHSERHARRDVDRMHSGMRRSIDEGKKSGYHAGRADAAGHYQQHREDVPTTLRRIEKLEAEERGIQREMAGRAEYVSGKLTLVRPSGGHLARLERRAAELADELAYWREHVAAREAEGVKVWSRADFAKGDWVADQGGRWHPVKRVNARSVTVPHWFIDGQTRTLPYSQVTARKAAAGTAADSATATPEGEEAS